MSPVNDHELNISLRTHLENMNNLLLDIQKEVRDLRDWRIRSDGVGLEEKIKVLEADLKKTTKEFDALKNKLIPVGSLAVILLGGLLSFIPRLFGH